MAAPRARENNLIIPDFNNLRGPRCKSVPLDRLKKCRVVVKVLLGNEGIPNPDFFEILALRMCRSLVLRNAS